jgi:hypothetical protein
MNHQQIISQLWEEMGKDKAVITLILDKPQIASDYDILTYASTAANAEKFIELYEGRWEQYYSSQSEADFAIIDVISFYTQNRTQITRIFHASALGKRPKAKRVQYLNYMLGKCFDNLPPEIDMDGLRNNLELQLQQKQAATVKSQPEAVKTEVCPQEVKKEQLSPAVSKSQPLTVKDNKFEYSVPPGLCGEIAKFIHSAAPRPVPEIAIAGAIGLMSGICGRAYNVSGTGLNTYTFVLAKTGRGKEAMGRGINKLISSVVKTVPAASSFVGPSKVASPPALIKYLSKTSKSFVSIMGEFADTLKRMSNDSRNPIQQDVRITMLDLYNKSGQGDMLGSIIYSDKDKNTDVTTAPSFSIIGEATPEKFYELLTKDMINEGLLPRCTIIEYHGNRTQLNEHHDKVEPSQFLIDQFSALCAYALQLNNGDNVIKVNMDEEAKQLIDNFDKLCDTKINQGDTVSAELWTRAHMKVLKLAALLAVGCNYINPIINKECAEWSLKLIINDVTSLLTRFESGDIGVANVQNDQTIEIKKAFKKYVISTWEQIEKLPGATLQTWNIKVVPHSFISSFCRQRACFKNDKLGPLPALKIAIQGLIDCDEIRELSPPDKKRAGLSGSARLYMVSGMTL